MGTDDALLDSVLGAAHPSSVFLTLTCPHYQNIMRAKCDKHNSFVTSLDFSDDGAYVQSDAGDFEHLYHSATDGQYFKLPSQVS